MDGYGLGPKWSKAKAKKPQIDGSFSKNMFRNYSILVELSKFDRSLTHTSTQVLRFADSCIVSAQRPSKPYTSICSPLMALPAAWSDHTAVVEFLLEKGAAVASAEVRPRCILQLRSSLAHSTLPFHAAVPHCRSMLPFHAAVPCCRMQRPRRPR